MLSAARRFDRWEAVEEAFRGALARQTTVLEQLKLGGQDWWTIEQLRSHLLYPNHHLRASPRILGENRLGQQALWGYGISGDHPLVVVRVREPEDLDLAALLLKAHRYWREQGFATELVLLNERDDGYLQTTHSRIRCLVLASGNDGWLDRPAGIVVVSASRLDDTQRTLLLAVARVVVGAGVPVAGALALARDARETRLPAMMATRERADPTEAERPLRKPAEDLLFDNGLGGFTADGREYVIIPAGSPTPAPWFNVLANERSAAS